MLNFFFRLTRRIDIDKVKDVDDLPEIVGLRLREVGLHALARTILDAFGSYPELTEVSLSLTLPSIQPTTPSPENAIQTWHSQRVKVSRTAKLETKGAVIPEWEDTNAVLGELLPLSKLGAGTFIVSRELPAVQRFLNLIQDEDAEGSEAEYVGRVHTVAFLVSSAFGTFLTDDKGLA
jgi:hypothetical protein